MKQGGIVNQFRRSGKTYGILIALPGYRPGHEECDDRTYLLALVVKDMPVAVDKDRDIGLK